MTRADRSPDHRQAASMPPGLQWQKACSRVRRLHPRADGSGDAARGDETGTYFTKGTDGGYSDRSGTPWPSRHTLVNLRPMGPERSCLASIAYTS